MLRIASMVICVCSKPLGLSDAIRRWNVRGGAMREPGLEPGSLAAQDPKSCAFASSATPAADQKITLFH